jgi:hypothetical protein
MHTVAILSLLAVTLPAPAKVSVLKRMAAATKAGARAFMSTFRSPETAATGSSPIVAAKPAAPTNPFPHLRTSREQLLERLRGRTGPYSVALRQLLEERYDFARMLSDRSNRALWDLKHIATLVSDPKRGTVNGYFNENGDLQVSVNFPVREQNTVGWVAAIDRFKDGDQSLKNGGWTGASAPASDLEFMAKVTAHFPQLTEQQLADHLLKYANLAKQAGLHRPAALETPEGENAYALALDRYTFRSADIESATPLQKAFAGQHTVFRPSSALRQWVSDWSSEHARHSQNEPRENHSLDYERVVLGYLEVASEFTRDESDLYRVAHHVMRELDRLQSSASFRFSRFATRLPKFRELMARDGKTMLDELRKEPDLKIFGVTSWAQFRAAVETPLNR